jgi:hypothetical protein
VRTNGVPKSWDCPSQVEPFAKVINALGPFSTFARIGAADNVLCVFVSAAEGAFPINFLHIPFKVAYYSLCVVLTHYVVACSSQIVPMAMQFSQSNKIHWRQDKDNIGIIFHHLQLSVIYI